MKYKSIAFIIILSLFFISSTNAVQNEDGSYYNQKETNSNKMDIHPTEETKKNDFKESEEMLGASINVKPIQTIKQHNVIENDQSEFTFKTIITMFDQVFRSLNTDLFGNPREREESIKEQYEATGSKPTILKPIEDSLKTSSRNSRDYQVNSDNYGWTYPSASGAAAAASPTGSGSSSYYPGVEYGKPSGNDGKYYSWSPPTDDKYKRPSYFTYTINPVPGGAPVECIPLPMTNIIAEMTKTGGAGKNNLFKNFLTAIIALFAVKIPIIFAIKALVFKLLILPATLLTIALPVLMPLIYFFLPSFMKDKDKSTTTKPPTMVMMMTNPSGNNTTRGSRTLFHEDGTVTEDFENLMKTLINDQSCIEKMACQFGVRDSQSQYRKPVSWVLKYVQTLKPILENPALRTKLKLYRDAYNFGAEYGLNKSVEYPDICTDDLYPCQKPQVILKQSRTIYKLV